MVVKLWNTCILEPIKGSINSIDTGDTDLLILFDFKQLYIKHKNRYTKNSFYNVCANKDS